MWDDNKTTDSSTVMNIHKPLPITINKLDVIEHIH